MATETLTTRCCIVGGGPAGMMLGFVLARAGVDVIVLEKHADFLRDFRGDTIHPSTLQLMHELGLLDEFLTLPHHDVAHLSAQIGDTAIRIADFSHLPTVCKYIAFMPQWDFLNFMAAHGRRYPGFRLMMKTQATGLVEDGGRIVGVTAQSDAGAHEIRADLVVGTDGRHSTVRERAGLQGGRSRRPDGRAVDAAPASPRRSLRGFRPCRCGPHLHHAGPRRLLAVRLRDPQRNPRTR